MQPLAPVYVWEPPARNIAVHLSLDVVTRLGTLVNKSTAAGGDRAKETGGLLLGDAQPGEQRITVVEDFEPFPCEYVRGASYTLSAKDRKHLEERLRRGGKGAHSIIGYYRSHTRPGLYLDQDDFTVADACFAHPSQVVLLVKPGPAGPTGGLFFWEEGEMRRQSSYLEFPFDAAQLTAGEYRVCKRSEQWIPTPSQPAPATLLPGFPSGLRLPTLRRWHAAVAGGVVLAGVSFVALRTPSHTPPAGGGLGLRLERSGDSLRLSWDRSAPVVQRATAGSVQIHDAAGDFRLELPARQIAAGSITYFPTGGDVSFDVEMHGDGGKGQEIVRAVTPSAVPQRPSPLLAQAPPPVALPPPQPAEWAEFAARPTPRAPRPPEAHREEPPVRTASPRKFHAPRQVAQAKVPPRRELASPPELSIKAVARAAPPLPGRMESQARVAFGPASPAGSRLRRIPELFRPAAGESGRGFVAPRPVRQVRPVVPASLLANSSDLIAVEVKVRVDQSGRVTAAELMGTNAPKFVQETVLGSVWEWEFTPALLNGRTVASQSVLRFRFEP